MGRVGVRVRSPQGVVGVRRAGGGELGWLGARPVGPPGGPKPKGPGGLSPFLFLYFDLSLFLFYFLLSFDFSIYFNFVKYNFNS